MASIFDRSVEQNKEGITLIWFDSDIDGKTNTKDTMKSLRSINDYILVYTTVQDCISYIKSVRKEKIFLVASGSSTPFLISLINYLKQIELIFIYSNNRKDYLYLTREYSKVSGVFSDREELKTDIYRNIQSFYKQIEAFSFYDQKQSLSMDLSERSADFLRFQLFHNVILRLPTSDQAKQQMINACRLYYRGNEAELRLIDEFEKSYTSKDCIRWYTRETFVYKMVNKALRAEDIQQLHTFRFIINDLSSTLAYEYNKMLDEVDDETIITVYRGGRLSNNDFEQFRSNQGKLISVNGYLSTSRLCNIALRFTELDVKRPNSVSVLFEIKCQPKENSCSVFADVSKFSDYPKEQEVLFDLGSVFKVETVSEEEDIWKISLTATDNGQEIVRQYVEETKRELEEDNVVILFGRLMMRMGYYEDAQIYFQQLVKVPGKENLAHIHNQLGLIYLAKAESKQAIRHFDTAYELIKRSHTPLVQELSHVLCNTSHVFRQQGQYMTALEQCNKAKQMLRKLDESYQLEVAYCLHSIGSCYRDQRKYTGETLNYYKEALNIKQSYLPENHVSIAKTLNSIGLLYLMMKDLEQALTFLLSALEMYRECLPQNHPDIANVLHNIAEYYRHKKQFDNALQHYQMALTMKENFFSIDHPTIALTLNNMAITHNANGEKMKALELYLKALTIRERVLPFDHPDLAVSFSNVGFIYDTMDDDQRALKYFEKALEIQNLFMAEDDPMRKKNEKHILRIKRKLTYI